MLGHQDEKAKDSARGCDDWRGHEIWSCSRPAHQLLLTNADWHSPGSEVKIRSQPIAFIVITDPARDPSFPERMSWL